MGYEPSDTFFLFYLGVFGKAVKVSDGTREHFLPLSKVRFLVPDAKKAQDPIPFTIPEWLARQKGLYDAKEDGLMKMVTLHVRVIVRGDRSWQVTDGYVDPVWIDKRMIRCKHINAENEAEIGLPEWYARKKGLVE